MADSYKKISEYSNIGDNGLTDNSIFLIVESSNNYNISWIQLKKILLGTVNGILRTIGLNVSGSIVTTDAVQLLTGKRFNFPCINSSVVISAKGEEINQTIGLTTNIKTSLLSLDSRISASENNIQSLQNIVEVIDETQRRYRVAISFALGSTTASISEATLLNLIGITNKYVVPSMILITTYSKTATSTPTFTLVNPNIEIVSTNVNGVVELSQINLTNLDNSIAHNVIVDFSINDLVVE